MLLSLARALHPAHTRRRHSDPAGRKGRQYEQNARCDFDSARWLDLPATGEGVPTRSSATGLRESSAHGARTRVLPRLWQRTHAALPPPLSYQPQGTNET
jgi:hypothetical protein